MARRTSIAPIALAALALTGLAHADPRRAKPTAPSEKVACADAHAEGQDLARAGKLKDARESFITCGRQVCPGAVRADCTKWLDDATQAQPSLVVRAKDARGVETPRGRVVIDGEEVASELDGRSIDVDPGAHEVRIIAPDGKEIAVQLVLLQGEKHRRVDVDFTTLVPKKPPEREAIPVSAVLLGGLGVAGLASFAFWGVLGKNLQADLEETCAPRCAKADADEMNRDFILADVSLVVGLLALGVGVAIGVSSQASSRRETGLVVAPTGGAWVGRF